MDDFEVDRFLVRNYGRKSPLELEAVTGVPALEVAQRLERVLGERDFLGDVEFAEFCFEGIAAASAACSGEPGGEHHSVVGQC